MLLVDFLVVGGYVLAASAGHVKWLFDLQEELSKTTSIAVVLVSYTLAPQGQYPLQLQQAAESLEWLVETKKKKAADVRLPPHITNLKLKSLSSRSSLAATRPVAI